MIRLHHAVVADEPEFPIRFPKYIQQSHRRFLILLQAIMAGTCKYFNTSQQRGAPNVALQRRDLSELWGGQLAHAHAGASPVSGQTPERHWEKLMSGAIETSRPGNQGLHSEPRFGS
jgi:hypothetical protein